MSDPLDRAMEAGDLDAMVRLAQERLVVDRDDAQAWFACGFAAAKCGDRARAIEAFEHVVRCEPGIPDGWLYLGSALGGAGRPQAAKRALRRCLDLEPGAHAALLLTQAHADLGEVEPARALLQTIQPTNADEHDHWSALDAQLNPRPGLLRTLLNGIVRVVEWLMELVFGGSGGSARESAPTRTSCPFAGTVRALDTHGSLGTEVLLQVGQDWRVTSDGGSHVGFVDTQGRVHRWTQLDGWDPDDPPVLSTVDGAFIGDAYWRDNTHIGALIRTW